MNDGRYSSYLFAVEGRRRAEAEVASLRRELESTKEEWDSTDGAHACWWRGHDNGAQGMKAKLEKEHAKQLLELRAQYEADLAMARCS